MLKGEEGRGERRVCFFRGGAFMVGLGGLDGGINVKDEGVGSYHTKGRYLPRSKYMKSTYPS